MIIISVIGVLIAALVIGSLFFEWGTYRAPSGGRNPRTLVFFALQVENRSHAWLEFGIAGRQVWVFPRSWIS